MSPHKRTQRRRATRSRRATRRRRATHPDDVISFAVENGLTDRSTIDSHPVRKQLKPKSKEFYDQDLKIWNSYLKEYPGSDPRDMQTMKHFAEAVWRGTKGRLSTESKFATPLSIRIKMRRFCNAWEREHHTDIPKEVKRSMAPFIQGELKDKVGAEDIKRPMTFLTVKNYVHMQEFLWFSDYHDYVHDGYRVDNSNLLNIHCFTSARLQEVCQATYQDIRFMVAWKDGEPEFKLGFKREYSKGMDEKQPEHPMAERMEGPDGSPPPLYAQPMLHWLVNFISCGALKDYHSIDEVLSLKPPEGEDFWTIPWAQNVKRRPVFPEWSANGPLGENRDPKAWGKQASRWAQRAGFINGLGLHASRREILIKTNDSGAAIGQVLKFAGQRNAKVLLNHYLDDMTTIDGAAIFLGANPRNDLTQDFRSATMKRNAQLPQTLPSDVKAALENQPEYVRLADELERLSPRRGLADEERRTQLYRKRRQMELTALKNYQLAQVEAYPVKPKKHEQRDWRKVHFDRTRHLQPERHRLATTLSARVHLRSPEGISALRDMIALRTNECCVAYQRALQPVDGCCPVPFCHREMAKIPVTMRWEHIFSCYKKYHKAQFGFSQFCFLCSDWETSAADWEAHCQRHIDNQEAPFRCDPVIFRTAVACAGYCPCCLSNESIPATMRMLQHQRRTNWQRHIHPCILQYIQRQCNRGRIPCPHPQCPVVCRGDAELWHHLDDVHSISKPPAGKRYQDFEDEATLSGNICRSASPPAGPVSVCHPFPEAGLPIVAEAAETALGVSTPSTSSRSEDSVFDRGPSSVYTPQSSTSSGTDGISIPCTPDGWEWRQRDPIQEEQGCECSYLPAPQHSPHHGQHTMGVCVSGTDLADASETWVCESGTRYAVSEAKDLTVCGSAAAQYIAPVSEPLPLVPLGVIDPALRDDPARPELTKTMAAGHTLNNDSTRHAKALPIIVNTQEPSSYRGEDAADVSLQTDEYLVDCLLGKWRGSYFVKWAQDGCYSWEPGGNILDDELVTTFEKDYRGFSRGVEVLRTRLRKGKTEYLLRCAGRPKEEDWWVPEKYMSPELVQKHKPAKTSARRGWRRKQ